MKQRALTIGAVVLAATLAAWVTIGHGWVLPLVWVSGAEAVPDRTSEDCLEDALHIDSVPFVDVDPYRWCDRR